MNTLASARCLAVVLAATALLLLTAPGCCLFDTDSHHHDPTRLDLCTAIAVIGLGAPLSIMLGLAGMSVEQRAWAATPVTIAIPDPPPWR